MTRIWPLALASTALLFSTHSFSADAAPACNTFAADYTKNAETYFHLDTGSGLNGQPAEKIADLGTLLDGHWHGHSSALYCVGHYTNSASEARHYSIKAEIVQKYNGALKLEAEKSDRLSVKLDRLYLAPELKRLNAPNWRNYSVEFLSPTHIRFDHKYRVKNGKATNLFFDDAPRFPARADCEAELYLTTDWTDETICDELVNSTRMVHEIKELNLRDDQLTVDHRLFVNGLFVSHEKWMLNRS